ncbi:heme lyase NrfEFG subunit NrfF [Vibrio vulnificus]|uniref:heme lyase NrfEFG subunit NrfF n=1 Tax=Vibrio vulnificus TaxID=672 RepID=UPI0015F98E94|nr:heme lyase NrfEFG subunit NrfF [Vibrio vulnificus]MCA0764836.1 heme lyase NrfEFG subunit NrfF [Vibrio vulnificus]MDT9657365.1 heme lyase NrfEFG subunit NrfF [Vibrio vulnificus]QMV37508.1 heme lyase NrfEFG subunit NrfF [Vibrio vulnificus]HAT8541023.1 heme lyase NrfEFG subunit NrfF [Vibrio vulnificus]HDY7613894.1 heme lyase NrfEFG subunit NrfF [Vibrio vulnificus]
MLRILNRTLLSTWLVLFVAFVSFSSQAQNENTSSNHVDLFQFHSVDLQERAIRLSKELRCPQCQNQNLLESNAQVARDLRFIVYSQINDGKSDQEVVDFMTSRYGTMVLYNPPINGSTLLLWIFPVVILIIFFVISIRNIHTKRM